MASTGASCSSGSSASGRGSMSSAPPDVATACAARMAADAIVLETPASNAASHLVDTRYDGVRLALQWSFRRSLRDPNRAVIVSRPGRSEVGTLRASRVTPWGVRLSHDERGNDTLGEGEGARGDRGRSGGRRKGLRLARAAPRGRPGRAPGAVRVSNGRAGPPGAGDPPGRGSRAAAGGPPRSPPARTDARFEAAMRVARRLDLSGPGGGAACRASVRLGPLGGLRIGGQVVGGLRAVGGGTLRRSWATSSAKEV